MWLRTTGLKSLSQKTSSCNSEYWVASNHLNHLTLTQISFSGYDPFFCHSTLSLLMPWILCYLFFSPPLISPRLPPLTQFGPPFTLNCWNIFRGFLASELRKSNFRISPVIIVIPRET